MTKVKKRQNTYELVDDSWGKVTEYISVELVNWAEKRGIDLIHIQPGKPTRNAFVERFNRTVRHEWLDLVNFESVQQAQFLATQWLWTYNNERPNSAIGGVPPKMLNPVV